MANDKATEIGLAAAALLLTAATYALASGDTVRAEYYTCEQMNCKEDPQYCGAGGTMQPGCWMVCPGVGGIICDFKWQ